MHTKSKDALDTIGTVLTQDEGRDAVHVAVICCEAAEELRGGDEVVLMGLANKGRSGPPLVCSPNPQDTVLGIVDPFIKTDLELGDLFWVFLMPRTITGLKHVWSHPAFPEEQK